MANVLGAIWHIVWICSLYIIVSTIVSTFIIFLFKEVFYETKGKDDIVKDAIEKAINETIKSIEPSVIKTFFESKKYLSNKGNKIINQSLNRKIFTNRIIMELEVKLKDMQNDISKDISRGILKDISYENYCDEILGKISLILGVGIGLVLGIMHAI